jgi:hypothetical protein
MYKLQKVNEGIVILIRTTDNASIPMNIDNLDYQEYLKWVSEGNTPLPADE